MAFFICEGRKSISIQARSHTPAEILLANILKDREIHELVWDKKKDVLLVAGLSPEETKRLIMFLVQNRGKDITIGDEYSN